MSQTRLLIGKINELFCFQYGEVQLLLGIWKKNEFLFLVDLAWVYIFYSLVDFMCIFVFMLENL